ncbi:hypothetical protein EYF80_008798 [Liparis tanakae]|uniref:Uncharacterized protein n=1 Tax=Liparis tanakae TaxID=230148 RepID=A0A4Z2IV42_9TELE|nr:hypothetical protein EYF80_008798 [Liparis tanakae]
MLLCHVTPALFSVNTVPAPAECLTPRRRLLPPSPPTHLNGSLPPRARPSPRAPRKSPSAVHVFQCETYTLVADEEKEEEEEEEEEGEEESTGGCDWR